MQPATAQLYTETGRLTPTPPFDFTKSLHFLGSFQPMQGEQRFAANSLTKAIYVAGQIVVFQLIPLGTIEEPQLEYTLFPDQPISDSLSSPPL